MKTARVIVDMDKGELRVQSQEDEVRFNLFNDVTECIADKNGRQEEVIPITEKQMDGSNPKEEATHHEKLETKRD